MEFKVLKRVIVFLIVASGIAMLIMIPYSVRKRQEKLNVYEKQYWNQLDVQFCGIVEGKKLVDHGFGYVCLKKTKSNKNEDYELYVNDEVFVCQIKSDNIIFITNLYDLNIGDSICYNIGGDRKEVRYRDGVMIVEFENRIIVPTGVKYSPRNFSCL